MRAPIKSRLVMRLWTKERYLELAQKCRSLAAQSNTLEGHQLIFMAKEYEAKAAGRERSANNATTGAAGLVSRARSSSRRPITRPPAKSSSQ
jgi:hypothetical protein